MAEAKAKRGDIIVLPERRRAYYINPYRCEESTEYRLGIVSSVTREGAARHADSVSETGNRFARSFRDVNKTHGRMIAAASRFNVDAETLIRTIGDTFESLDAIRAAMAPYIKAEA